MRIVHIVDYLMPQMGYQEFLLQMDSHQGHEVFIITSDRYTPFLIMGNLGKYSWQ